MRNWSVCVCVQYGIKKRVPIEPSQDPALEGRLGRKKKTPEELAAEAELAEQQALRSSTYNNALVTVVVCSACPGVGSTTKYVSAAHSHPPCGRRYSDSTKQRRVNFLVSVVLWTFLIIINFAGGRPKRTWREVVQKDCQARKLNREDAMDRSRWRKLIKDE